MSLFDVVLLNGGLIAQAGETVQAVNKTPLVVICFYMLSLFGIGFLSSRLFRGSSSDFFFFF